MLNKKCLVSGRVQQWLVYSLNLNTNKLSKISELKFSEINKYMLAHIYENLKINRYILIRLIIQVVKSKKNPKEIFLRGPDWIFQKTAIEFHTLLFKNIYKINLLISYVKSSDQTEILGRLNCKLYEEKVNTHITHFYTKLVLQYCNYVKLAGSYSLDFIKGADNSHIVVSKILLVSKNYSSKKIRYVIDKKLYKYNSNSCILNRESEDETFINLKEIYPSAKIILSIIELCDTFQKTCYCSLREI